MYGWRGGGVGFTLARMERGLHWLSGRRERVLACAVVVCVASAGCERPPPPPGTSPTTQPAAPSRATEPIADLAPGWDTWTVEDAVARLDDEQFALSAAVRLVRLAELQPVMLPDPLPADLAATLAVVRLADDQWAVGVPEIGAPDRLWGPVLIARDGGVTLIAEGTADPVLLRISDNPEVFPHVAVARDEVVLPSRPDVSAIWLVGPESVGFAVRFEEGYPYIALVLWDQRDIEVARYTWEPWELVFVGPAGDSLPDPPGGEFEMDLDLSELLEPVGGIIEEPIELPEQPAVDLGAEPEPA